MTKIMITLEDGTKADVNEEAFNRMKQGIEEGDSKVVVKATVE